MYKFESGQLVTHDDHGLVEILRCRMEYTDAFEVEPDSMSKNSPPVIIGGDGVAEFVEFILRDEETPDVHSEPVDQFVRKTIGEESV